MPHNGPVGRDGRFRGFEGGGLFIKTDCLNPGEQIEAYYACLRKDAFLENVLVTDDGSIDFYDMSRTTNGRAVVERRDFMHAANSINARRIDNLFLITRGSIIPAVAKLTHEQAAAFMVLGQSMESSAGDPTQAGTIKNEFFTTRSWPATGPNTPTCFTTFRAKTPWRTRCNAVQKLASCPAITPNATSTSRASAGRNGCGSGPT